MIDPSRLLYARVEQRQLFFYRVGVDRCTRLPSSLIHIYILYIYRERERYI